MLIDDKVAVFPLSLDGAELALLLMFSPSLDGLCTFLHVPDHLRQNSQNTYALVALLPWLVSSTKYNKGTTRKPVNETIQRLQIPSSQPKHSRRRILKGTVATVAMDLLAFPPELLDFMNLPNRSYCVWFSPADGTTANPGFETRQLKYLLSKTSAASVSIDKDARVIFIHVGALETFYNLSALVAKRRDTPEVRFFTYGTHESVPCSRWGMREVLPLGEYLQSRTLNVTEVVQRRYRHLHAYGYGRKPFWMLHFNAPTRTASSLGMLPDPFDLGFKPFLIMRQGEANVGSSEVSIYPVYIGLPT